MYQGTRQRCDWFNVQRRLAQTPHLRMVVGSHRGRPALVRGTAVLAVTPKDAFAVIRDWSAERPALAA